ncbi:MAG: hypothetical protein WCK53_10425 [Methanomicrobiales archaeon]
MEKRLRAGAYNNSVEMAGNHEPYAPDDRVKCFLPVHTDVAL